MYIDDAIRFVRKNPGFTAAATLTLAAGIGANSAIFSFVSALLLRPLPFPDADRLVRIESVQGNEPGKLIPREWEELDRDSATFAGVAGWYPSQYNLTTDGKPQVVTACMTTANLFRVLGVNFAAGSSWQEGTHRARNPVVVLSHGLWTKLGSDRSIIRQSLTMDDSPYMVTGVTEAGFQFPVRSDVYRAAHLGAAQNNNVRSLFAVARLQRGVSPKQAQSRLVAFAAQQAQLYPDTNRGIQFRLVSLREAYVGEIRPYLLLTLGLVAVVLMVACTNVINLLLARGISRSREFALRAAIGADRRHLLGQLLSESLILNLLGGLAGLGLAWVAIRVIRHMLEPSLPAWMEVRIDGPVLLFTFSISVVCGVIAGLYPAVSALHPDLQSVLREGARGIGNRTQSKVRQWLIAAELAMAVVLLVAAGLLVRSFQQLRAADTGFRRTQLVTFRSDPPWARYNRPEQTSLFYRLALEKLEAVPGVSAAAANHSFPLALNQNYGKPTIVVEGQSIDEQRRNPFVNVQIVSPNYLRVVGVPLLEGRNFTAGDRLDTTPVAILSRPLAHRLFGSTSPLGRRIRLPELLGALDEKQQEWFQVIGIAEGVRSESLLSGPGMDLYLSNQQQFAGDTFFILRTGQPTAAISRMAAQAIREVDPQQPIFAAGTVEDLVEQTVWQRRIAGQLSLCFGVVALLLAAIGTYGLLSYAVFQRSRELAIRQALGSTATQIQKLVVGEGMRIAAIGSCAGLVIAIPAANAGASLLYGVSPLDGVSIATAVLCVLGVAFAACYLPARRASRISPLDALKAE